MPRRRTLTGRKERELNRSMMNHVRGHQKKSRDVKSHSYRENAHFFDNVVNFETAQKNLELKHCNLCHRPWNHLHIQEDGLCSLCHKFQIMKMINNIETDNLNRTPGNDFQNPIKLENRDIYEQRNSANEVNEIKTAIVKIEKVELETLEENAIKKEQNETEETTENSIENPNYPIQDMRRSLELYADHEIVEELVIGPVVLQQQTISLGLNDGNTIEDVLEDSTSKPDPITCDVGTFNNKRRLNGTQTRT